MPSESQTEQSKALLEVHIFPLTSLPMSPNGIQATEAQRTKTRNGIRYLNRELMRGLAFGDAGAVLVRPAGDGKPADLVQLQKPRGGETADLGGLRGRKRHVNPVPPLQLRVGEELLGEDVGLDNLGGDSGTLVGVREEHLPASGTIECGVHAGNV